jgi:hypothetical protein
MNRRRIKEGVCLRHSETVAEFRGIESNYLPGSEVISVSGVEWSPVGLRISSFGFPSSLVIRH